MFSIKQSFADCSSCDLLSCPSCILETNCEDDLTKVDIIFVAENPGKAEVNKEVPLIGKAGQMFRKYFKKFNLDKQNYLLTNCVLCQTLNPDGTTSNPEEEVIDRCKINCMNIIRSCNPKLIVLMGSSPMSAFGFGKSGITTIHGKVTKWEKYQTMILVHPSFVNRNVKSWEPKFEQAMANVAERISGNKYKVTAHVGANKLGTGIYRYTIPEKFYTDEYKLIDVQFLRNSQQVLYIFRDKNNKKIYYKENDDYICYQPLLNVEERKIVAYEKLQQIMVKYRDKDTLDSNKTYEGDVRISTKHAQDYYHFNKGEPTLNHNIMFFDIEIDTGDDKIFPSPQLAFYRINMFTSIYNGKRILYVIDNKTEPIEKLEGVEFKIFQNEKSMILQFIKDFKLSDPDFIAGWNLINFDLDYIYNRLPKLGIKQESFSTVGQFYVDGPNYLCHLGGCVALDQEFLYRTFTFTKMENYKLGFIAAHELDGYTKLQLPLPFNEMYWKLLNKTIEYNIRDTELLEKLEDKLKHINLLNELRIICDTSFEATSSFGQIDSLMVGFLKKKGLGSKNHDPHIIKKNYPGGFVFEPIPNLYEDLTDFDFASLYPSLMLTYNIGVNSFVMKFENPELGYDLTYQQDKLPEKMKIIFDPLYAKKTIVVERDKLLKKIKDNNLVYTINGCFFQPHDKEFSVFGEVVDMIMESRTKYKGKMFDAIERKDPSARSFFFTRQLVYKVLANTLYGVVANKSFRFFDLSLATAITLSGQEALKTSIIYGDAFMRKLINKSTYEEPIPVTKEEMYSEIMPKRSNDYIITGDTDSIFCCFKELPEEERNYKRIRKYCDEIEQFLNKDKIIEMVKKHNVDVNFNRLKLKNELFIAKGLFLKKKRYVIRITNNEGKEVDEIAYMGVEIKRSDYPSESKKFLVELTDILLKEKFNLTKIMEFIARREREFIQLIHQRDKTVSRPISWGKKLEDYKSIPQGVKAMQAWNSIMYPIHKHGTKAYMYWVSGIDLDKAPEDVMRKYHEFIKAGNKFKVIAIPDEEERLPEYFIVDKKSALEFTFNARQKLFLKPILKTPSGRIAEGVLTF